MAKALVSVKWQNPVCRMTREDGNILDIEGELLKGQSVDAHVHGEVQVTQDSSRSWVGEKTELDKGQEIQRKLNDLVKADCLM